MDQNTALLLDPLDEIAGLKELVDRTDKKRVNVFGVSETSLSHLVAYIVRREGRGAIVVEPNELACRDRAEEIGHLLPGRCAMLTGRDITFLRAAASSKELAMRRLRVLGDVLTGKKDILVATIDAFRDRLIAPEAFRTHMRTIRRGDILEPDDLARALSEAGYERVSVVEGLGQYTIRGGIADVYPVGGDEPVRIEFFDDEIDSIRSFDVLTQRSVSEKDECVIYPAKECVLSTADRLVVAQKLNKIEEKGKTAAHALEALTAGRSFDGEETLLPLLLDYRSGAADYLKDGIVFLDGCDRLRDKCEMRDLEFTEMLDAALGRGEAIALQSKLLFDASDAERRLLAARSVYTLDPFPRTMPDGFQGTDKLGLDLSPVRGYHTNVRELAGDIVKWKKDGWRIALLAGGSARGRRLEGALGTQGVSVDFYENCPDALECGHVAMLPLTFGRGFLYPGIKLAILSENDVYGVERKTAAARKHSEEKMDAFTELKVGDYVVHESHGIGQYMGTVRLTSDGAVRDFLHIRYQGTDKLYVPTDQMSRVQKYIGSEGEPPKLNKLSGGEWQKQKARVKASVTAIATELVKLYAAREAAVGYAFLPDTPWQREFEDNFPYEETPDQLTAIADIKRDMEQPRIMDRLLCGDVGYGKTEVALRAIFKCVMSGKQAVLLAPTTILVQQHYATMMNRFEGFPVHVDVLSRFKTAQEQKKIIEKLKNGEIDVVVGTHRLLAKDVGFKNLGLLVVDEEQRFGVTHKEKIKQMKKEVDVLTLTATPIPRTLHMSMVGIRDMSLLQSPPEERYPVQTYVVEYSDALVRDALQRELARGGQAFVLYNRVQTIEQMYMTLTRLLPDARIGIGHGQMPEHELEEVMLDFYDGKYDILLCTTIIEAGLDVPRCNTLIVCDADHFGLSQLYQLRGRVGRSNRLAYAYFTFREGKLLTENADKRLAAIREFTEFGSGFRVAMRDLEIRGAGNLLGSEQSGFMATVGYDLYVKMIEESVQQLKGGEAQKDIETKMELGVDAYLPTDYIPADTNRIEMYKRISHIRTDDDMDDVIEELIDRFGEPPRPVMNLVYIARLKSIANAFDMDLVAARPTAIAMRLSLSATIDVMRLLQAVYQVKSLHVAGSNPPNVIYDIVNETREAALEKVLRAMQNVKSAFDAMGEDE